MFNKKIGLLALACAAMGLAGCNKGGETPDTSKPQGGGDTGTSQASNTQPGGGGEGQTEKIPAVEGKIGIYFDFVDTENAKLAEMPEYVSIFITGQWNVMYYSGAGEDPLTSAVEMQRLGETNTFYAYIPNTADLGDLGYQIALGYNNKSGVGAEEQGIDWDYKTLYSAKNFAGLGHPVMTMINDHLYACLSDESAPMGFAEYLPYPTKIYNCKAYFTVDESVSAGLASNLELAIKGKFNGWEPMSLTKDNENKYWFTFADETNGMIMADFDMCIGVRNKVTMAGQMDDKYNLALVANSGLGTGGHEVAEKETVEGVEQIVSYKVENIALSPDTFNHEYNLGTLTKPEHASGTLDAYAFPSNDLPAMTKDVVINLEHTGETALDTSLVVAIAGNITGETWPAVDMTAVDAGRSWTHTVAKEGLYAGSEIAFKFNFGSGAANAWLCEVGNAEGQDIKVTLDANKFTINVKADMTGWGTEGLKAHASEVSYLAAAMDSDIVVNLEHTGETALDASLVVAIAGNITGETWPAIDMTAVVAGKSWTYTISKDGLHAGSEIAFKFNFGSGNANAWLCEVGNAEGQDIKVTLAADKTVINVKADMTGWGTEGTKVNASSIEYVAAA